MGIVRARDDSRNNAPLRPRRLVRCGTGREAGTPLLCFSFRGDPRLEIA